MGLSEDETYLRMKSALETPQALLAKAGPLGVSIAAVGFVLLRIGLVLVLLLIGMLKFTPEEARGIQMFVAPSPLFSWLNLFLSNQQVSDFFGTVEISTGILIATRPLWPVASAIGSALATVMLCSTVTFLFTTPGVWSAHYGFPFLDHVGEFLLKDVTLLGAAVVTLGEALQASARKRPGTP